MRWLVRSYSPEGGRVLDPWVGTASTGEACLRTGRRFVGIERDEAFFASASDRLRETSRSLEAVPCP
jgi:site-specific DNA-methyltransferase (adenine-specific)